MAPHSQAAPKFLILACRSGVPGVAVAWTTVYHPLQLTSKLMDGLQQMRAHLPPGFSILPSSHFLGEAEHIHSLACFLIRRPTGGRDGQE